MESTFDSPVSPLIFSYKGLSPDSELLDWIAGERVGGVVLFRDNARHEPSLIEAIRQMRSESPGHMRIMIDEEGGDVCRLPQARTSMQCLRSYEHADIRRVAQAYRDVAERLLNLDIDTLLAPVVDVGSEHADWMQQRTYSNDVDKVTAMAHAVIPVVQGAGVTCCAKHFPGSRAVTLDTHVNAARSDCPIGEWTELDAPPFVAAIACKVAMVMVGHQIMNAFDPIRPACLSPLVVRHLLRERLGYEGLVATDDLAMRAISGHHPIEVAVNSALDAGCDLIVVCNDRTLQRRTLAACEERRVHQRQ